MEKVCASAELQQFVIKLFYYQYALVSLRYRVVTESARCINHLEIEAP